MKVAVVGAGWAGLSAAVHLHRHGHEVTVFEAARTLGGRARSVYSPRLNMTIDNGQHILLGAYNETCDLLADLGLAADTRLHRRPFALEAADGRFLLAATSLPTPFHLLAGVVKAHGLTFAERVRLVGILLRLRLGHWKTPPGITVAQWLDRGGQSSRIVRAFWQPLCLAAMNTPVDGACAQLFANVLRDSLGADRTACDILIPSLDLSDIWPEHLPDGITVHRGQLVRQLTEHETHIELHGHEFDHVVLATNIWPALRLMANLAPSDIGKRYLAMLAAFEPRPIATITIRLDHAWRLPQPMFMLNDHPDRLQFGQWLFDRSVFMRDPDSPENALLSVVVSDAGALAAHANEDIVAATITQIKEQTSRFAPMPTVTGYELITEKRATFAAVPHLKRPTNQTPWRGIWVAGDWTNTRYPAVLEGAVRSGRHAANLITRSL